MPKEMSNQPKTSRELTAARLLFAGKVRAARAVIGWSQTELASKTGLTQRAIYKIEQGAVDARPATMAAIDIAFAKTGIGFEDVLEGGFRLIVPIRTLRNVSGLRRKLK
jgi:transcriptional regulator with XRE-family HTH domain